MTGDPAEWSPEEAAFGHLRGDDTDDPGVLREEGETLEEAGQRLRARCTVAKRTSLEDLADALRAHPKCAGVDVLAPNTGPRDAWTLEATLTTGTCPPGVLWPLAQARLDVVSASPRGTGFHVIAIA